MPRDPQKSSSALTTDAPSHPIISDDSHRDTLDRVAHVIELLKELDLSDGLTPSAVPASIGSTACSRIRSSTSVIG